MSRPPRRRKPRWRVLLGRVWVWFASAFFGILLALLVFGALPFMQMLGDMDSERNLTLRTVDAVEPPPPQNVDLEEPPPPEEAEPEEKPQMDQPTEAPNLGDVSESLNPGTGGAAILKQAFDATGHAAGAFAMNDDIKPRPLQQVPPKYPPDLAKQGVEGVVKLEFTVDANGRVQNPRVVESPHRGFESSALQAIRQWRFEPGRRGGQKVPMKMRLPMRFAAN